jgi:hypothetical protein
MVLHVNPPIEGHCRPTTTPLDRPSDGRAGGIRTDGPHVSHLLGLVNTIFIEFQKIVSHCALRCCALLFAILHTYTLIGFRFNEHHAPAVPAAAPTIFCGNRHISRTGPRVNGKCNSIANSDGRGWPTASACDRREQHMQLSQKSPCFPRPKSPHGVPRAERERSPLRPGGNRPERGVLAAEVIEQMAELIVRAHERDCDTV